MPSRKTQSGRYRDIAHPITAAFRDVLQTRILDDYQRSEESADAAPEPGSEAGQSTEWDYSGGEQ